MKLRALAACVRSGKTLVADKQSVRLKRTLQQVKYLIVDRGAMWTYAVDGKHAIQLIDEALRGEELRAS